ncbi:MAG: dipeptidase [Bacteroidales bacterium]|nr:MAG: dipeptidase [Bacteroidales bacterium]
MNIQANDYEVKSIRKITLLSIIPVLLAVSLVSCKSRLQEKPEDELWKKALKICKNNIILDSHNDWPHRHFLFPGDISKKWARSDFDLPRAKKGGLNAVLSVVFASSSLGVEEGRGRIDSLIRIISYYTKTYPDKFAPALNPDDIKNNYKNNLLSLPLCLENGTPIGDDLGYLEYLKNQGIVYITISYDKANQISDSSYDTIRKWDGLSPFGLEVIKEMNRLGIMIDISHSTDSAVFQTLQHSKAPIIASHSSCRHFTPGYERNISDTLIKVIEDKNGVVMINFGSFCLDSVCVKNCNYLFDWYDSTGISMHSEEGIDFTLKYKETHKINSDAKTVADHIEHVIKLAGIDHVGMGSDYNGMGLSHPSDLPDVSGYPVLVFELLKRGYTEEDINKILSENFLRVWNNVIEVADSLNKSSSI